MNAKKHLIAIIIASIIFILLVHHTYSDLSTWVPIIKNRITGEFAGDTFIDKWPPNDPAFFSYLTLGTISLFGEKLSIEILLPIIFTIIWIPSLFLLTRKLFNEKTAVCTCWVMPFLGFGIHTYFSTFFYFPRIIVWAIAPLILYMVLDGLEKDRRKLIPASLMLPVAFLSHPQTALGLSILCFITFLYKSGLKKGFSLFILFCIPALVISGPYLYSNYMWSLITPQLPLDSEIIKSRTPYLQPQLINYDKLVSDFKANNMPQLWSDLNENLIVPYIIFIPLAYYGYRKTKNKILLYWTIGILAIASLTYIGPDLFIRGTAFRNLKYLLLVIVPLSWEAYFSFDKKYKKALFILLMLFAVLVTRSYLGEYAFATNNLGITKVANYCELGIPENATIYTLYGDSDLRFCGYNLIVSYKDGTIALFSKALGEEWWKRVNEIEPYYENNNKTELIRLAKKYNADYVITKELEVISVY